MSSLHDMPASLFRQAQDCLFLAQFHQSIQLCVCALHALSLSSLPALSTPWTQRVLLSGDDCPLGFQVAIVLLQAAFEAGDEPSMSLVDPLFHGSRRIPFIAAATWIKLQLRFGRGRAALRAWVAEPPASGGDARQRYAWLVDTLVFDAGLPEECGDAFAARAADYVQKNAWLTPGTKRDLLQKIHDFEENGKASDARTEDASSVASASVGRGGETEFDAAAGKTAAAATPPEMARSAAADRPRRDDAVGVGGGAGAAGETGLDALRRWANGLPDTLPVNAENGAMTAAALLAVVLVFRNRQRMTRALGQSVAFVFRPLFGLTSDLRGLFLGSSTGPAL
jgi:hypothetical protein